MSGAAADGSDSPARPGDGLSRECLLTILDELPWVVSYWGLDLRNAYINRRNVHYLGRPAEDVLGMHLRDVVGEELFVRYEERIAAAVREGNAAFEHVWTAPDGHERHMESFIVPHLEDGEVAGYVISGGEITERVSSQGALQEAARVMTLLQERQRMAEDLHDLVIQRLFAAGLDLAVAGRGGPDAQARIDAAARSIDQGIRELRGTIHDLHQRMTHHEIPERIEQILRDCGRVLGFDPTLDMTVDWSDVSPPVSTEVTAVLNEALSNVVKHAGATTVGVTLAAYDASLLLRVADDGRGVGETGRSSGLANMRHRAEKLGGTLEVKTNEPHGTVLEWTVPSA